MVSADVCNGMSKCNTVMFHHPPVHIDEVGAYYLARRFGKDFFPEIHKANFVFWSSGTSHNMSWQEYWKRGVLMLGTGGGPFDEHPTLERDKLKGQCSATLMAEFLGVKDRPALRRLLRMIENNDVKGIYYPLDIGAIIIEMHMSGEPPEEVIFWALRGMEAFVFGQTCFHNAVEEFWDRAIVEDITVGTRTVTIAAIETDNPKMSVYARSQHGVSAAIFIQRSSRGNVQVLVNKRVKLSMDGVVCFLREREAELSGRTITNDPALLVREGNLDGHPEWYYIHGMILNGSHTAPDVSPTKIPLTEIIELVKLGVA